MSHSYVDNRFIEKQDVIEYCEQIPVDSTLSFTFVVVWLVGTGN